MTLFSGAAAEFWMRWVHYIFGILWIGHLYYFNFSQTPFMAEADAATGIRAVDILAQRLPTVPQKAPETDPSKDGNTAAAGTTMPEPNKPIVTSQPQRGSPGNAQPGVLVLDPKGAKAPAAKAQPGQGVPGKEQNKKPIAPLKPTPPPPAEPASQDAPQ